MAITTRIAGNKLIDEPDRFSKQKEEKRLSLFSKAPFRFLFKKGKAEKCGSKQLVFQCSGRTDRSRLLRAA